MDRFLAFCRLCVLFAVPVSDLVRGVPYLQALVRSADVTMGMLVGGSFEPLGGKYAGWIVTTYLKAKLIALDRAISLES